MLLRVIGALLPQIVSRLLDISEAVLMTGSGSDRKTGAASPRLKIAGSSGGMRRCTRTERRWCGTVPKVMRTMSNVAARRSVYEHLNADRPAAKVTHGSIELHSVRVLHLVTHNDRRCAHNRSVSSQSEQVR